MAIRAVMTAGALALVIPATVCARDISIEGEGAALRVVVRGDPTGDDDINVADADISAPGATGVVLFEQDLGDHWTAGRGCSQLPPRQPGERQLSYMCDVPATTPVQVFLGNGTNHLSGERRDGPVNYVGGSDDDRLKLTAGNGSVIDLGPGDDRARVTTGRRSDSLRVLGGPGDDKINVADGWDAEPIAGNHDVVDCGPGRDEWAYYAGDTSTDCEKRKRFEFFPGPTYGPLVFARWRVGGGRTVFTRLRATVVSWEAPQTRIRVRCTGASCPIRTRIFRPTAGLQEDSSYRMVDLHNVFRRPLAAGVSIRITYLRPGNVTRTTTFITQPGSSPPRVVNEFQKTTTNPGYWPSP